jgi:hypothetical protein
MAKEIFCAFGVDVDAVAGWLGSYGGEDSPDDISRGLFAGEVGLPRLVNLFKRFGIKTTWFIPGPFDRDLSRADADGGGGRPRDRHSRLFARESDLDDAGAGRGRARQVYRPGDQGLGPPPDRLRGAVVGVQHGHQRAAAQEGHQVRPQS